MERQSQTGVVVAFCSAKAARYACKHWHYSGTVPPGAAVRCGVWESGRFIGVVIFTKGAGMTTMGARKYGLTRHEACELARVALTEHRAPVTQIISEALRLLKSTNPGLRLVISFADPAQGHHGGIYQAGNWTYTGQTAGAQEFRIDGRWRHARSVAAHSAHARRNNRYDTYRQWLAELPRRSVPGKHRYLYPLDRPTRRAISVDSLPYPSADQVSEARRQTAGLEGSVQSRRSAL